MERKKTVLMVMGIHLSAILMIGYISGCTSTGQQQCSVPRARIRDDFGRSTCSRTAGASNYCAPQPKVSEPAPRQYTSRKYTEPAPATRTMMANTGSSAGYTTHVVRKGETLCSIGREYNVTFKQIAAANGITNPNDLNSGQVIRIPVSDSASSTTTMIAKKTQTTKPETNKKATKVAKDEPKPVVQTVQASTPSYKPVAVSAVHGTPTYAIHVVQSGENIWRIAKKYDVSVQSICSINGIDQSAELSEGERIKIPVN